MTPYHIYQNNVIKWAEEYEGEPFHALLCDPPYHLTIVKRFGQSNAALALFYLPIGNLGYSMTTTAKGFEVSKVVGFQIGIEQAKRDFVMHLECLVKLCKALFSSHSAILTNPFIPTLGFSLLGLPIGAILMLSLPVNILGVILTASVGIAASARAILTCSVMLFQLTLRKIKSVSAIEAVKGLFRFCRSLFDRGILTLRGAMLTPTMLKATGYLGKSITTILAGQLYLSGNLPLIDRGFSK